jgi:ABC-type lipoprotein release transport system permease subunit
LAAPVLQPDEEQAKVAVSALAPTVIPARRAIAVDPIVAIRDE